ncbi:MAG TPA: hypothetical protein VF809_00310 [Candidatus Saccharimonadales bacterium]
MTSLYEQIGSDEYWNGPTVENMENLTLGVRILDSLGASAILNDVDLAFYKLSEGEAYATPLEIGEELTLDDTRYTLLKVVKDTRLSPGKGSSIRPCNCGAPGLFDQQAQAMVDELLFRGQQAVAQLEGPNGAIHIARRVIYLLNSLSGQQLIGKESGFIGIDDRDSKVNLRHIQVGYVNASETSEGKVEKRIISAKLLRLSRESGRSRKRVFDLGAIATRLLPDISPAGA